MIQTALSSPPQSHSPKSRNLLQMSSDRIPIPHMVLDQQFPTKMEDEDIDLLEDSRIHPTTRKPPQRIEIPECVAKLTIPMQAPPTPPTPPPPPPPPPLPPIEYSESQQPKVEEILSICTGKHDELTETDRSNALMAYALFEKDGRMSLRHLPEALRFLGLKNCLPTVTDEAISTRTITVDHFLTIVRSLRAHKCKILTEEEREFKTVFDVLDKDGDGLISITDLKQIITDLGLALRKGEAAELVAQASEEARKHRHEPTHTPPTSRPTTKTSSDTNSVDHSSDKCIDFQTFALLMRQFQSRASSSFIANASCLLQKEEELRKSCEQMANLLRTASNSSLEELEEEEKKSSELPKLFSLIDRVRRKIHSFEASSPPPSLFSSGDVPITPSDNTSCPLAPVPIHSDYWLESDGLTVYRSTCSLFSEQVEHQPIEGEEHLENGEEVMTDDEESAESDGEEGRPRRRKMRLSSSPSLNNSSYADKEEEYRGRIYSVCLKPYVDKWKEEKDPTDGQVWQEKLGFHEYFTKHVWPSIPPETKEEMKQKWTVEYLKRKDLEKNHRVRRTDSKGNIINPATGEVLGPGLWMFVMSANQSHALYVARKVYGKIHHTSLARGRPVACAGMLVIADGTEKIKTMANGVEVEEQAEPGRLLALMARSGHYKPSEESMLNVIEALVRLGVRLDGALLIYHEDEASRSFRIGGLQGVALMSKVGTERDSKVRISTTFLQHLARQELKRVRANSSANGSGVSSSSSSPLSSPSTSSNSVSTTPLVKSSSPSSSTPSSSSSPS